MFDSKSNECSKDISLQRHRDCIFLLFISNFFVKGFPDKYMTLRNNKVYMMRVNPTSQPITGNTNAPIVPQTNNIIVQTNLSYESTKINWQ